MRTMIIIIVVGKKSDVKYPPDSKERISHLWSLQNAVSLAYFSLLSVLSFVLDD